MQRIGLLMLGILIGQGAALAAGPWYVAKTGDDANTGLSWEQAVHTIGSAVAKANAAGGGEVVVSNGVYTVSAEISISSATTVRGVNGRTVTVVDGNHGTRCFTLNHPDADIQGFTIRNGSVTGDGGGILLTRGSVRDCLIVSNTATATGGGVRIYSASIGTARVQNCEIVHNTAGTSGGGLCSSDGYWKRLNRIEACTIVDNYAQASAGWRRHSFAGHRCRRDLEQHCLCQRTSRLVFW